MEGFNIKKILFIFDSYAPLNNMAAMRSTMIVKYMKKSGLFDTTVLTTNRSGILNDFLLKNEIAYADKIFKYNHEERYWLIRYIINLKRKLRSFLPFGLDSSINYSNGNRKKTTYIRADFLKAFLKLSKYHSDKTIIRKTLKYLKKNINLKSYDLIISSYGPFIPHMIASRIKRKFPSIYWIADFRDPVIQITTNSLLKKLSINFTQSACLNADLITVVSKSIINQLNFKDKKLYYHLSNGFDSDYIKNFQLTCKQIDIKYNDKFNIALTGTYYSNTNLISLFTTVNKLILDKSIRADQICFHFYVNDFELIYEHINQYCPMLVFEIHQFITRDVLFKKIYFQFDLMLILTYGKNNYVDSVPGKIFEYLGLKKYVLGIVNGDTINHELSQIIRETNAGMSIFDKDIDFIERVSEFLLGLIEKKKKINQALVNSDISSSNYSYYNIINAFIENQLNDIL